MPKKLFTSIRLWNTSSDPGSPTDGDLWYRDDLDKIRGQINGTTENLSTETYATASGAINPRITSGRWYWPNGGGSFSTGTPSAGNMVLTPLYTGVAGTINGLAFEVTTQGNSASGTDQLRIGLYADDGSGVPTGAALFDSGLQNLEVAPGVKTVVVSWTGLTAQLYWLGRVRQTTGTIGTAAQLRLLTAGDTLSRYLSNGNATPAIGANPPTGFQMSGVTGALPTLSGLTTSVLIPTIILVKYA